uniref:Sorting nexin 5 n=1 Tax=Canis lupus familiaris TaxID=9615 RepID=A0A8C0PD27_CANLF
MRCGAHAPLPASSSPLETLPRSLGSPSPRAFARAPPNRALTLSRDLLYVTARRHLGLWLSDKFPRPRARAFLRGAVLLECSLLRVLLAALRTAVSAWPGARTTLPTFQSPEFSVTRQHEDFVWLHDTLIETADYAGLIIPPAPTKPDFDGPREKMQKLGEGEGSMTKEEFAKMKQELEAEYLAVFKKTVSSHEVFLQRLSSHPVLSKDRNFHVFLEYDQDLSVRRKNTKEMFGGFFKSVVKSADEVLFSGVKEVDDFFEQEKNFLINYYNRIKDSCAKADKMTRSHKNVADDYIHTAACLHSLALEEPTVIKKYLLKVAELFEKLRKVESRVSSDEDLKLTELLRYYMLNIEAAKDLLYRRTKALTDYENSNKALDKARLKSKDVKLAESHQQECCQKFEQLSESAKEELINFKRKRVAAFRKNLIEMSELEIKHARNNVSLLQSCIDLFKNN